MTRSAARRNASTETVKVYNSTDGPLPYDAEGRIVGARESADVPATVLVYGDDEHPDTVTDTVQAVDVEPLSGHLAANRFILVPVADETDPTNDAGDAGGKPEE